MLRQVLLDASATVDPTQSGCMCGSALDGVDPPYRLADPGVTRFSGSSQLRV